MMKTKVIGDVGRMEFRMKSGCALGLSLVALVVASFRLTRDMGGIATTYEEDGTSDEKDSCNLFSGRWVYDNVSYPLYEEQQCSFMASEFACQKYGRRDVKYQQWRWQPHHCDLPRFNGTELMEKIRGKRVVFVGDSLNRNQWVSMLCLIESSLNQSSKEVVTQGNLKIFKATEYNATIEFYWSPLLVESNGDDPISHSIRERIMRITAIEKHARHWTDADILIFNAYLWWLPQTMTLLWGSFNSSDAIYKTVDLRSRHYEMGLNTWSDWLEIHINRTKTNLFFMSPSPIHSHGESWEEQQVCYNATEPIFKQGYWGAATFRDMMDVAESTIQKLQTRGLKIQYLNITHLTEYRKDAHPSIYRNFFHTLTEQQLANPKTYADCVHWCLPGVPDVWNHILFSYIMTL